jgi:hypothetical protein
MGGHWIRVEDGWKWHNGATFPSPGGDAVGCCIELPNSPLIPLTTLEPGDPDGPNDKTAPLREDLRTAIALLREGKQKFSPNTTNSLVDDFLSKFDEPGDGQGER